MCFSCALICACAGGSIDGLEGEELERAQIGFLDNVKVLRRSYGPNRATAISTANAYLEDYTHNLLLYLVDIFGLINFETTILQDTSTSLPYNNIFEILLSENNINREKITYSESIEDLLTKLNTDFTDGQDYFKYYFDATRYQITEASNTPYYLDSAGNYTTDKTKAVDESKVYYRVVADTSLGWNWGLNYTITDENIDTFLGAYLTVNSSGVVNDITDGNKQFVVYMNKNNIDFSFAFVDGYYKNNNIEIDKEFKVSNYTNHFYNETTPTEFEKALTYAIYSLINKDDPTGKVAVLKNETGTTFTVDGYEAETVDGKTVTSVDKALAEAKAKYENNASYVGLSEEEQGKIVKFILSDVIGSEAVNADAVQDLYYNELVEAVVTYCTALTQTGDVVKYEEGDDEVISGEKQVGDVKFPASTMGGSYLSSEIVDYEYNSSLVDGQKNGIEEFAHLGEYEYQSMLLMPKYAVKIDEIMLDFAYLGDAAGADDEIEIITYVRYYKGGGKMDVYEQKITVKETSLTENNVYPGNDGTTLLFDFTTLITEGDKFLELDKINFDKQMASPYYLYRKSPYALPDLTTPSREIVFGPTQAARNYYGLLQGDYRDYGVFNYNTLKGAKYDQKYVEIAFEVVNVTNKVKPNYKFLCGISWITQVEEKDLSMFK